MISNSVGDTKVQPVEIKEPFWAKCVECKHIWIGCYLPMEMTMAAKILGKLHCPMCGVGAKKITPAKQDNGVLQEPQT